MRVLAGHIFNGWQACRDCLGDGQPAAGSSSANQTTDHVTVVYLPLIADVDVDVDGLPDVWETANSVNDPNGDPDLDGITTIEEYKAGTDPQSDLSRPEGVGGVNYVLFRDVTSNSQFGWFA